MYQKVECESGEGECGILRSGVIESSLLKDLVGH